MGEGESLVDFRRIRMGDGADFFKVIEIEFRGLFFLRFEGDEIERGSMGRGRFWGGSIILKRRILRRGSGSFGRF